MVNNFEEKLQQWRTLDKEQKRTYFFTELLEHVIQRAKNRWEKNERSKYRYDFLISMSGFSPETTIITYHLVKPRHLIVISSKKTDESVQMILKHIAGEGKDSIPGKNFIHTACEPTSVLDIFRSVKQGIEKIHNHRNDKQELHGLMDITGGKKVMSAAAAFAAWHMGMEVCYLESKTYDPQLRMPLPGSEELIFLDNPMAYMELIPSINKTGKKSGRHENESR